MLKAGVRLAEANRDEARERAEQPRPLFTELRARSLSLQQIAAELNARGIPTARDAPWSAVTVSHVLQRLAI